MTPQIRRSSAARSSLHRIGSQSRIVWSSPALARRLPSGLKATLLTQPVWPRSGWPRGCRVATSHSRTVWSAPVRGQRLAVGAEGRGCRRRRCDRGAAGRAAAACPRRTARRSRPGRRPRPSRRPGLNATALTKPVGPLSGAPSGLRVSASHSRTAPSCAGGGQRLAVGAEGDAVDRRAGRRPAGRATVRVRRPRGATCRRRRRWRAARRPG